jgi:hypothetical protein
MPTRRRQVNLGLSESQFRVLEALRFLNGNSSNAEVLLPLVSSYLDERASDPEVQDLLQRRATGELPEAQ